MNRLSPAAGHLAFQVLKCRKQSCCTHSRAGFRGSTFPLLWDECPRLRLLGSFLRGPPAVSTPLWSSPSHQHQWPGSPRVLTSTPCCHSFMFALLIGVRQCVVAISTFTPLADSDAGCVFSRACLPLGMHLGEVPLQIFCSCSNWIAGYGLARFSPHLQLLFSFL